MVRVFLHNTAQSPVIGKFLLFGFQVQRNRSTTLRAFNLLNLIVRFTLTAPAHAFVNASRGTAGLDHYAISNNKRRIKAHTKLTNQLGILLLIAGQVFQKLSSARLGNSTQIGNHLLSRHTYTIVGNFNGLGLFIHSNTNTQVAIIFIQRGVFKRFKTQFVSGIGGVRN